MPEPNLIPGPGCGLSTVDSRNNGGENGPYIATLSDVPAEEPARPQSQDAIGELIAQLESLGTLNDGSSAPAGVDSLNVNLAQLSRSLNDRYEQERRMARIYERIVQGLYLDDVLDEIYESFRSIIPYNRIGCALLEDGNSKLTARWGRSDSSTIRLKPGYTAPMAGSSLLDVMASGKPRIIDDLEAYYREHPQSRSTRLILAEGVRSSLTCPLVALGAPVGFLFFSSFETNTYSYRHQDVFLRLAAVVSTLVVKARLFQELADLNKQLSLARDQLQWQATHDGLTSLLNRSAMWDELVSRTQRATVRQQMITVLLCDLDRFKLINDTYGHQAGDAVLVEVARRLSEALPAGAMLGRYGGEEFLVVADVESVEAAQVVAESMREVIGASPVHSPPWVFDITVSIGMVTGIPSPGQTSADLVRWADIALYQAKDSGRNCVVSGSWGS